MRETINAIYENGVFKPSKRPDISDGQSVRLIVERISETPAEDLLELAAQVYKGLSSQDIDEIEQIALNRRDLFRKQDVVMDLAQAVLDTDILSAVMKKNPVVIPKARAYLTEHDQFTLSILTRYEILRGLKAKGANKQAKAFDRLCAKSVILSLTDEVVVKAAKIYAELHARGELIGDAYILIGASALVHGLDVVTNNEHHFRRIKGLKVQNCLK